MKKYSSTGNRTRVSRVRAVYPNQLDYKGIACMLTAILMLKLWQTHSEYEQTAKMNQNTHRLRLQTDRKQLVSNEIYFTCKLGKPRTKVRDGCSESVACLTLLLFDRFFYKLIAVVISILVRGILNSAWFCWHRVR